MMSIYHQSNIRHNLTLKSMFVKVKRKQNEPVIGNDWMINVNMGEGNTRMRSTRNKKVSKGSNKSKSKSRGSRQSLIQEDPDDVVLDESDPSFPTTSSAPTRSQHMVRPSSPVVVSRRQSTRVTALIESREVQRIPSARTTAFPSSHSGATRGLPNPYQYFAPSTNSRLNSFPRRGTAPNQASMQQRENIQHDFPHTAMPSMRWDSSNIPQIHPFPPHTDSPSLRWDVISGGSDVVDPLSSSRAGYQQVQQIPANRGRGMIRGRGGAHPVPQAVSARRPGVWTPGANISRTDSDSVPPAPPRELGQLEPVRSRVLRTLRSTNAPPTLTRGSHVSQHHSASQNRGAGLFPDTQTLLQARDVSIDDDEEGRDEQTHYDNENKDDLNGG